MKRVRTCISALLAAGLLFAAGAAAQRGMMPKDRVEVRGSRILFGGKAAMIAAEVRKGDDTLVLRDAAGFPVWSGWRRR